MTIVSRGYDGDKDFDRVRQLLIESYTITHRIHIWWLERWEGFRFGGHAQDEITGERSWEANVRLWEVVGDYAAAPKLVGVVNPEDGRDFFVHIHPSFRHIEEEMVEWAEQHHEASRPPDIDHWPLSTFLREHDVERAALLARRGYRNLGQCGYTRRRTLSAKIPDAPLPDGFVVRNICGADEADLVKRAAVANHAFNSTRSTLQTVRVLQEAPTYREDLDLVVVAPDGTFAAYCVIWFGEENRIGWYEPVGTHPAYRRLGLAKAMMCDGLWRLQALGAAEAYVGVGTGEAANRLYESAGFSDAIRDFHWQKTF